MPRSYLRSADSQDSDAERDCMLDIEEPTGRKLIHNV